MNTNDLLDAIHTTENELIETGNGYYRKWQETGDDHWLVMAKRNLFAASQVGRLAFIARGDKNAPWPWVDFNETYRANVDTYADPDIDK
jgi:hypothetical protein